MTSSWVWFGLLSALLSLGAYRLSFGALGVVLDTRPAGLALAAVSLALTVLGLRRWRTSGLARRAAGPAALIVGALSAGLAVHDLFFAYRSLEVRFSSGEIPLAGTLYLPRREAPPYPAVIITHGAGEETRGEGEFYARLFARNGIAGLAYDKRGSGESGGDLVTATYQELAADALAALHDLAGRNEIDVKRIGLWGVSEGGWVVPIAAAAGGEVGFLIVVSATAESPAEQVRHEVGERVRRAGYGAEIATQAAELYAAVSQFERTGQGYEDLAAELRRAAEQEWFEAADYLPQKLLTFEELKARRWYPAWRSNMDFDAPAVWRQVHCPVLVLLGGSDPKIDAEKASSTIRGALVEGGNPDVTVRVIPRAEHGLAEWWLPLRLPPPRFPDPYPYMMVEWILSRPQGA